MNGWILASGVIALFTACVHVFAGQVDPVKPFLKSDLPDIQKATLLGCWHLVSAILIIFGCLLAYSGWANELALYPVVSGISITYLVFSIVFIGVGWFFFGKHTFIKLPQWVLLMPVGGLGLIGTVL